MIAEVERLKEQLAALGGKDRAELARFLLENLPAEDFDAALPETADVDPQLLAELERRERDYLSGKSPAIPAHEVFARLRAKYV